MIDVKGSVHQGTFLRAVLGLLRYAHLLALAI
jgi:hypothetical protein